MMSLPKLILIAICLTLHAVTPVLFADEQPVEATADQAAATVDTPEQPIKQLAVGDIIQDATFKDQFGNEVAIDDQTKMLVICYTDELARSFSTWLTRFREDFCRSRNIIYICDMTKMLEELADAVAIPMMRRYHFSIFLERGEAFRSYYPYAFNQVTVIHLDQRKVTDIELIASLDELTGKLEKRPLISAVHTKTGHQTHH